MEEDQNSVETEVTPQDQQSTVVEEQQPVEASEETSMAKEDDSQDRNWKELRRKESEAQGKVKMQDELIRNLLEAQKQNVQQATPPLPEVDEFAGMDDDEYLSLGKTRKLLQKESKAIARREFQRLQQEDEQKRFHSRLKSRYSDFDEVVNPETIAHLEKQEPELASTIADLKDPYKMGLQTYHMLKGMSPTSTSPNNEERHAKEVQQKIEENGKTVQSPQAYNKRPMAQAFSMTNMGKEEKTRLYEETMGHASKVGFGY